MAPPVSSNAKTLGSFVTYCAEHPEQRFWQALCNWSRYNYVGVSNDKTTWRDTWYWIERDHQAQSGD